jgi:hypothetical protein
MKNIHFRFCYSLIVLGLSIGSGTLFSQQPAATSPAGYALDSIFNPRRAPAQKTMGLLQRSFLDLVETSQTDLEIALVIDGTDSMADDIQGVRATLSSMLEDLRKYKGDHVRCALVIYRDSGASSGEVTVPLREFTEDVAVLQAAIGQVTPESGSPYFLELPDLGIHQALSQLPWSEDEDTSRWLLLFGDAPPYDPDFQEAETGARRRYDTDLLVELAQRKDVQISCVLCTSREDEQEAYQQVLDKTRQFMNRLATESGGLMLDLSYPDIRNALVEAARTERVEHQRIGVITREEIEAARDQAAAEQLTVAPGRRLRLAILPHMPLAEISFDPDREPVQIATELREKFRMVPEADVKSPVDVERALRRLKSGNVPPDDWLQALALRLGVDYVVWGTYRRDQVLVQVKSAIYGKADGQKVAEAAVLTSATLKETDLAGNVAGRLMLTTFERDTAPDLVAAFAAMQQNANLNQDVLTPVSSTTDGRTVLMAGFEALEQALGYPLDSGEAQTLLGRAERSLLQATQAEPRNPFAQMVLASCLFNQAERLAQEGLEQEVEAKLQQFSEALKRAYRLRDNTRMKHLQTEIEADYQLLIKKDHAEAVRLYESLAQATRDTKLHVALRAHWMLAGIFSGDWDVDASAVDPKKARQHLVQILAHWPDSDEAGFIKRQLRWDEEEGHNQFEHFPREHTPMASEIY